MKKILVSVLTFFALTLSAADDIAISPPSAWINAATFEHNPLSSNKSHFMEYPLLEVQYDIDQELKFLHVVKKLISTTAVQQQSNIEIEFDPTYEAITLHSLTVHRGHEKIDKISTARMEIIQQEQDMTYFQYNGNKTLMIFLDDIQPGDVIDYSFTKKGRNPILKGHFCEHKALQSSFPMERAIFRLISVKDHPVYFMKHNTDITPINRIVDDKQEWIFKLENVPAYLPEDSEPTWFDNSQQLQISDFHSWQEVAQWGSELFDLPQEYSSEMKQLVVKWKAMSPDPEQQALQAVRFVQNDIRYLGFEIGSNTHKPHNPNIVLQHRFGDCKDKTLLLKAFLDLLGIESHPMLVSSWRGESISKWHPATTLFNHVILQVCLGQNKYCIDSTDSDQGGTLRTMSCHHFKKGLVLDPCTTELTSIAKLTQHPKVKVTSTYLLSHVDLRGALTVKTVYTGAEADVMRSHYKYMGESEFGKRIQKFYAELYGTLTEQTPFKLIDDFDANKIVSKVSYQIDNLWKLEKDLKRLDFFSDDMRGALEYKVDPQRKTPLRLKHPMHVIEEVELILLESGDEPDASEVTYESEELKFHKVIKPIDDKKITIYMELLTKKDHVPVENLTKHRDLLEQIYNEIFMSFRIPLESVTSTSNDFALNQPNYSQQQNDLLYLRPLPDNSQVTYNESADESVVPHNKNEEGTIMEYIIFTFILAGYAWIVFLLKRTRLSENSHGLV